MLAISIKLNHRIVAMGKSVLGSGLKANRQTAINGHVDNSAPKSLANFKRGIPRAIVDNNKIKLGGNFAQLANGTLNTFFFVVRRNCNKNFQRQGRSFHVLT